MKGFDYKNDSVHTDAFKQRSRTSATQRERTLPPAVLGGKALQCGALQGLLQQVPFPPPLTPHLRLQGLLSRTEGGLEQ